APLPAVTVTETSILTVTNEITKTVAPSSEYTAPIYTSSYGSVQPTSEQPVVPTYGPAPTYGSVQPTSEQPGPVYPVYSPSYSSVAPSSEQPAPVYPTVAPAPAPSYGSVQPSSEAPAPVYPTVAPAPAPVYPTVAPAPSYGPVQPTSEQPSYGSPAPGYGNVAPEKPNPPAYQGAAPSEEQPEPAPYAPVYKLAPPPPAYGHPGPTTIVTVTQTPTSTSTHFVDTTSEITVTQTVSPDRDHHGKPKKHGNSKPQGAPHVALAGVAPNPFLNPVMPENPWIKAVPNQAAQRWGATITGNGQMISGGNHANVRVSNNEKHQPAPRKFMEDVGFYLRHGAAHNAAH
ncbi:hypothetical protein FB639_004064, partial [Coemansia asiatica]